jgi:hypothetical protein
VAGDRTDSGPGRFDDEFPPTAFPDPRLVAAIVDRVTRNAYVLEPDPESWRLRTSKTGGLRPGRPMAQRCG